MPARTLNDLKAIWSTKYTVRDCGFETPCWVWNQSKSEKGYARCVFQRRVYTGGRLPWMMFNGPIPDGLCACHKCDNPSCVRPDHIFLGTKAENNRDCKAKKRNNIGSRNGQSVLDENSVKKIKLLLKSKAVSLHRIGRMFSVHHATIWDIKMKKTWRHV